MSRLTAAVIGTLILAPLGGRAEGDTVIAGPGGAALVTFLDGSTVTIEPRSEVVVKQVDSRNGESSVRLLLLVGKVWARVAQQLARRTSLSLESNAYAATAHDGLIGAERRKDGTFVCWTRRGDVTVRDAAGPLGVLTAGRKLTASPGKEPRVETFQVHDSTLEIIASANVLPLMQMPDGRRVAGWTLPGVEINQVFGSLTAPGPRRATSRCRPACPVPMESRSSVSPTVRSRSR